VLEIAPGWHIQAHTPADPALIASDLEAVPAAGTGGGGTELRRVVYPPGQRLGGGSTTESEPAGPTEPMGQPPAVYTGRVEISGELRAGAEGGRLRLIYQVCDESRCLPRVEREIPIG
jgi:hypothetical protein